MIMKNNQVSVVLGAQWGDEGKGKLIDILGEKFPIIVRGGGGANAGHTIVRDGKKYVFHLLPSGLLTEGNIGIVGNGCVVHLPSLAEEIKKLEDQGLDLEGRVFVSDRAHLLFDFHREIDGIQEERKGKDCIGTTKRGIGPCYSDKISRAGVRAIDFVKGTEYFTAKIENALKKAKDEYGLEVDVQTELDQYVALEWMKEYIVDTAVLLEKFQKDNKNILVEGAQAFMLDIDYGTYPFVTSSSINTGGIATGCGLSPRTFTEIIGVLKAYCTRVGAGPFPAELSGEVEEFLRKEGGEYGATTGRPRRCGWLDLVMLKNFIRLNTPDCWNITKLDVLDSFEEIGIVTGYTLHGEEIDEFPATSEDTEALVPIVEYLPGWKADISGVRKYEDLPENAKKYIKYIEEQTGVPAKYIGVGAGNEALIIQEKG